MGDKAMHQKAEATDRPFVFINVAMAADGKIATADRKVSQFASKKDHDHLLELRTEADAVMCGARTADLQPVTLGTGGKKYRNKRLAAGRREHHIRIVVSSSASVNPQAEVFCHRFSPILLVTSASADPAKIEALEPKVDQIIRGGEKEIDFKKVLAQLKSEWGIRRLLCEGGGRLNGALFDEDLIDEVHVTICPILLGGREAPTMADGEGVAHLGDATRLTLVSARRVGAEMFAVYRVNHRPSA